MIHRTIFWCPLSAMLSQNIRILSFHLAKLNDILGSIWSISHWSSERKLINWQTGMWYKGTVYVWVLEQYTDKLNWIILTTRAEYHSAPQKQLAHIVPWARCHWRFVHGQCTALDIRINFLALPLTERKQYPFFTKVITNSFIRSARF